MNRIFFLREPLSRALGLLAATLMLNACERVWDNPADPEAPSYQGYTSVKTADEIEAVTPDGTEMIYQSFLVNEVLEAQAYRLEIATDKQFSNVIYMKDTLTSNFMGANASLPVGTYYWRGSAKKDGVWGKWTGGRGFKLVSSITSMKPASGISTTDTTPEFSWTAVAGAAKYEIQIADSAANLEINPTVDDKNVSGASYTPTALTNLQMYHWRVRAVDGEGQAGAWSGTQTLNINFDTVSGLNPANGSTTTDITPEFSWTAVVGATRYEIQIADSAADLSGSSAVNVPGTSYTPTTALTNLQTHHWRVRAVDGDGQFGAWSGASSLRVEWGTVSGLNPANGSSTTDTTPEFSWTAVAGATRYEIQIADSAADLAGSQSVDVNDGTSYTPTTALTNLQMYHWRVRAVDGDGQPGAWSGTQTLNVNFDTVSGLNPANGSTTTDITPEFSWTAVAGADKYQIQIADSAANLAGSSTVNVPGTSYTPTTALTNLLTHHWRVRAVDSEGQAGAWSGSSSLRVEWGTVSGLNPANGSSTTDITPEFSWTAVAGAAKYEIQIADSAADLEINPTVDDKNVSGTSYTPTTALTNKQTHHWRVRAVDGDGQAGAWSGTQTLNINFDTVSGLNPANGSSTTDTTPEFSWTAVAGADKYQIQIADSEANLAGSSTADAPGASYTPTTALTNKQTHHWRVRAVDSEGQPGAWSGSSSLRVEIGAVSGLNPTDGSRTTDTTPTFSWTAVTGADKYQIQIADSAANLAGSSTVNVPGTRYTPTTALTNLLTHHWRVRAVDSEGQFGAWSGASSLRVEWGTVSGLDPTDGSSTTDITPEFSWTAVAGATRYEIQIADSATDLEINPTVDDKNVSGTSYTPTALTNKQTHHWRVRAVDGDGQAGAWSGSSSISIFITVNNDEDQLAFVGQLYSLLLANAVPSVTYNVSPALPGGLKLDTNGRIHGVPTTRQLAKEYTITITPTSGGRSVSETVSLFIKETAKNKDDLWRMIDEEIEAQGNTADLNLIDTSKITDMSHLFNSWTAVSVSNADYSAFNGDISGWNVSGVTDMSWMFYSADAFNGDISKWDVSSVKNMSYMFSVADAFNGNIASWDVSNVKNMRRMFSDADAFNGDISSWNVSNVTDMSWMFEGADAFNGDISSWNVSNVTDMSSMFWDAAAFNGDIASWNVSNVTDMSQMFSDADAFNGDISSWNVSNVTDMSGMFTGADAFNGNIASWNVSGVTNMSYMFYEAKAFNGDISSWNVSGVKDMNRMFFNADAFNGDIASWNVSNVTNMSYMFYEANAFNGDLSEWNVSNVKDMSRMFSWAVAFNGDISKWDVSGVTDMRWMFNGARAFNRNLEPWGVHLSGREVYMDKMFEGSGLENTPSWY